MGHFGGCVLVGFVLSLLSEVYWKYVDAGESEGVLIYMQPRTHVFYILNLYLNRNIVVRYKCLYHTSHYHESLTFMSFLDLHAYAHVYPSHINGSSN